MKILLITCAARGHAIAEALSLSHHSPEIISICSSANPGIKALASKQIVLDILDFEAIKKIANDEKPDFAFIAPDDPIGFGLADALEDIGIPSVAPKKNLARIESSKGYARELFKKKGIDAGPLFRVFTESDREAIRTYLEGDLSGQYVVKYDALKGGKGVKVSGDHLATIDEGVDYAVECIDECGRVVIEEKMVGPEFSLLSFVSGSSVVHMPAVQDHKRAHEGDTGPNTGGMGTYSDADHSLPFLSDAALQEAKDLNQKTAEMLQEENGEPFKGILFGGFIVTARGTKVIEYNARFGDPEALNILPLLESDFVDVCLSIIDGSLDASKVSFAQKATVCKYITPKSYPEAKDQRGEKVEFPSMPENARLFFGDVSEDDDVITLGGSRSAGIVGIGDSIEEAEKVAQELCEKVEGPVRFRKDIGTKELIQQRIDLMDSLR